MEALTGYLRLHAGLHVGVALVDLSIWCGTEDALLVVPQIPFRTVLVERGMLVIGDEGRALVESPVTAAAGSRRAISAASATTASEPVFYQQLDARRPGLLGAIRPFLTSLEDLAVSPEYRICESNRTGKPDAGDR